MDEGAALPAAQIGDKLRQSKHVKREIKNPPPFSGPHVTPGNKFPAPLQVDTKKTEFVCIPTRVDTVVPKP